MIAALTYDDGPSQWTAPILDLLAEHGAHATFFVLGAHVAQNESLLCRMRDDGHEIGNHTWLHPHLSNLSLIAAGDQLLRTTNAILAATADVPSLWRAPFLDTRPSLDALARKVGLTHVGCDIIAGDWKETDPQRIAQNSLSGLRDGMTVLLHDGVPPDGGSGTNTRRPTVEATALLLGTPGVTWVSVGEL